MSSSSFSFSSSGDDGTGMAAEDGLMVVASNACRDLVSRHNEVERTRKSREGMTQAEKHEEERRERDGDRSRKRKTKKRRKRRKRDDENGDERRSRNYSDDSEDDNSDEDRKRRRRKEKKRERKQDSSSRDRKKSGHRKHSNRLGSNRSRSLSRSDDSDERQGRRDRRKRRRNNKDASDTKTESQALVVVEKDTAQSKMDAHTSNHKEQTEKRLPRPSAGRSFASVSKTVVQVRPQSNIIERLMIEDGRVEDDGTKERHLVDEIIESSASNQPVDMVQAYRNYVLNSSVWGTDETMKERRRLFLPFDFEENITEEKYVERQKRLNEMVRSDPTDEDAWMALANLHQPLHQSSRAAATHSKRSSLDGNKEIAGLKRKREILTRAIKYNVDSFDLRVELITTLERLCLFSEVDDEVVAEESGNAIRLFEVLAAEEVRDKISPHTGTTRVHNLVYLHRMRLRRLTRTKCSRFNANRIRESYIEALSSVSKVQSRERIGGEVSVIFLDYLRMEALMGYSERAIAVIQAVLEMNFNGENEYQATGEDSAWEASFFDYWNSEAPRIGDAYPCAGWLGWKNGKKNDKAIVIKAKRLSRKMNQRMKAKDFFSGDTEADVEGGSKSEVQQANGEDTRSQTRKDRKNKLVGAYETAAASQLEGPSAPTQSVEKVDRIFSIARSAIQKQQERQRFLEQIDPGEEDDGKAEAKSSTSINVEAFAAQTGEVVPSQIQNEKVSVVQVYSFLHHRRIEVSKEELSGEATKHSLQTALKRLRQKNKDAKDDSTPQFKPSKDTTKLYMISEDDGFLQWSEEEARTQDLFSPPLRSTQEPEPAYDQNWSIWVEDGIQWIAAPFFSSVDDDCGLPALVSVCLEFLGVTFPRSSLTDAGAKDAYVLSPTTNGGERISDIGCTSPGLEGALGVFEVTRNTEGYSYSWSDVYSQLLADESIVLFDERIFRSGHEKEMRFVRNVLHDIVSRTEPEETAYAGNRWTSYVQIALILYESRAAGEKAAEVARGILSGTEAAKSDPRLWIAYAQLEFRQKCSKESVDKAYKAKTRILLAALEAGGSDAFHGDHGPCLWIELAVATVRSMLHLPIGSEMNTSSFNIVPIDQHLRNRLLHVICCAIEGKFVALPKIRKGKETTENETAILVDDARLRKCRLHLQLTIQNGIYHDAEVLITPPSSAEMFDSTPKLYHLAILAAWLNALDSQKSDNDEVDFDSGVSSLNEWASKLAALERSNSQASTRTCLVRLVHAQLEFALLQFARCRPVVSRGHTADASSIMTHALVPNIVFLKSIGLVPSRSLLLAAAYAESQLQATPSQIVRGYESILCPFLDYKLHAKEVLYIFAKAIFVANYADKKCVAEKNMDADGTLSPHDAECCTWTRSGRKMVETSLLSAIDKAGYCCYPPLWSALLRLKLLGSLSSTRNSARAFGEAKTFYHENIVARCSYSKRLWLDGFTLLRPTYSDVEMIYHMAAMEEKDIRLKKGLEAIMRMTGGKDLM